LHELVPRPHRTQLDPVARHYPVVQASRDALRRPRVSVAGLVATAAAAAAATTAAAATAAAAAAATALLRLVDLEVAPVELLPVPIGDRRLRLFSRRHLDEAEAARPTRVAVGHDLHFHNRASVLFECCA